MKRPCDVCGGGDGRTLTADDRSRWPSIAPWIRFACADCRKRFERNAERGKAAA